MKKIEQTVDENVELLENDIVDFFLALNKRIVRWKNASSLSNLLEDIKPLSELNGLMESIISNTKTLKRRRVINAIQDRLFRLLPFLKLLHIS